MLTIARTIEVRIVQNMQKQRELEMLHRQCSADISYLTGTMYRIALVPELARKLICICGHLWTAFFLVLPLSFYQLTL